MEKVRLSYEKALRTCHCVVLAATVGSLFACGDGGVGAHDPRDPAGDSVAVAPLSTVPGHDLRKPPRELAYKIERVDPAVDGWTTEVLNETLGERLHDLADVMKDSAGVTAESLAGLVVEEARIGTLRPEDLHRAFEDPALVVYRQPRAGRASGDAAEGRGAEALSSEVRRLVAPFAGAPSLRIKLKLVHIEAPDDSGGGTARIEVYYQAVGDPPAGRVQQNATWDMVWQLGDDASTTRLRGLESRDFREVRGPRVGGGLFADYTEFVLGAEPAYREQLLPGQPHWGRTLDSALGSQLLGHHGVAVADVDGDGLEDVYLAQPDGLPNRLFLHQPDGSVREASAEKGVDYLNSTTSALLVDLDNDGDQDLIVATRVLILHENDGTGAFEARAAIPVPDVMGLAAADYDNDGDLDLYASRYSSPEDASPVPYHDATNGNPNQLLRNDGGWVFTDATAEAGLDENNDRYSFAAAWGDLDNDGWADLYVANDFGRNNLYLNEAGRFRDVAAAAGVEDISAGMSATWGDADADGDLDLYVSNMFSSAGNRTAYQRRFQGEAGDEVRKSYQRHARGNSLFLNASDGTFVDASVDSGVTMGRWAWSSKFGDLNNDGLEDILVLNGYVTNEGGHDL